MPKIHPIRPLNDNVLLTRSAPRDATDGGIIIPDSAKKKTTRGKVIITGPGKRPDEAIAALMSSLEAEAPELSAAIRPYVLAFCERYRMALRVKAGDEVIFGEYGPNAEFEFEGEKLVFMREDDLYGIVD